MAAPPRGKDEQDGRRLERLVRAGIRISAERAIETVLQEVVDSARDVIGARYAALGVLDSSGDQLEQFVVSGLTREEYERIGALPTGRGILRILIDDPRPLRLKSLKAHKASAGFPPNHPPMTSFLGVPIIGRHGPIGNLYVTDKIGGKEFSKDDEHIAVLLAAQAAVALENARLYEESERLLHEVRSMQTSRDHFFAMINHELRNALTAVYGWADLLKRKLGAEAPRAAVEVYESAERTLNLVNDVLDLSRLEAERLEPVVRDTDAWRLVQDAVATVEPTAGTRSITIETTGPTESVPARTDPQRVRQILINLLSNAIRHSPDGERITLALKATNTKLEFAVIDCGEGIAAEHQAEIFEAFRRGSSDERGTGLGLTLSRHLAHLLQGDLKVQSQLGAGATFTLRIERWMDHA